MSQNFESGDFLVFQLEAGFALLRILDADGFGVDRVWHLTVYRDFFLDVESAETASRSPLSISVSDSHLALTNRAFESTQVAKISNQPLNASELEGLNAWRNSANKEVSDRSVRLLLGVR